MTPAEEAARRIAGQILSEAIINSQSRGPKFGDPLRATSPEVMKELKLLADELQSPQRREL